MSEDTAEGEVTPRAAQRVSSPERTPGRSPEGHVTFLVREAEERSQRRAAAIRNVLESIRIVPPQLPGQRPVASVALSDSEASERHPATSSLGPGTAPVLVDEGIRSSVESTSLEELLPRAAPQAETGPEHSQREVLEAWKIRCESLEKALETCRLEAQESLEASQAELVALEGRTVKREAELRQEIIDLRSQHSKEREKWRAENKRLQSSLKDTQRRAKAESEAKSAATEQVEVLRQQLSRLDTKSSRNEKEAKHLEELSQRHADFLRHVATRCAEACGEALDANLSEDSVLQLLSKALRGRQLPDQPEAKTERSENLHTEWRGRVRAAEQAQKKMQRVMQQEAEAQAAQREIHTEEVVELKLRVNALQRAKEVSERFVEEEEESWIRSKAQLRDAEAEVSSALANARHFEAEARCASEDAVRAQAKATGAEAAQRRLQAELETLERDREAQTRRSPAPLPPDLGKAQQRWRDTAVLEEVSEAQRQMGHWRQEAERSCAEVTQLRASCQQLQLQSEEQVKVEEAKRKLMQQALKEQAHEMQLEFDGALREVQDLRDKQGYELQERALQLQDKEMAVSTLTAALEDHKRKQVESAAKLEQLQQELSQSSDLLHLSEASAQKWQSEAVQQKEQLNEEMFELHQSYAKRLQSLRAQHGGEKRAFQAVEDELRQICSQEVQMCRRNQEAWSEAMEAAIAGEAAEARVARLVADESESARARQESEVQEKLQEQLLLLKKQLAGPEPPVGLCPASHELFRELCWSIEAALCDEVRQNPCSELRRTLRRDLKQELRDQLRSEARSTQRCREASTGSTTGSSARRFAPRESPPSAIRQELTRRGALLMEAFTLAAEEVPHLHPDVQR